MPNGSPRALAFTLATQLHDHDLEHVSGGYAEASTRQSVRLSCENTASADVQYDVVRDFDF